MRRTPLLLEWFTPVHSGLGAMLLGLAGVLGWVLDVPGLRAAIDGFPPIALNSALLLILGGALLIALRRGRVSVPVRIVASLAAALLAASAALTLYEHLAQDTVTLLRLPLQLLARRPATLISSPHAALAALPLALGLLAQANVSGPRWSVWIQGCALATMVITLMVLTGYLFSVTDFYRLSPGLGMSLFSFVGLATLSLGLFNLHAEVGLGRLYYGGGAGSRMLRTFLPLTVVWLLLFFLLGLWGDSQAWGELRAIPFILALLASLLVLGRAAGQLNQEEARRCVAQAQYSELFEGNPDAILVVDARGRIVQINAQAEHLTGYARAELLGQSVEILVPPRYQSHHIGQRASFQRDPKPRPMGKGQDIQLLRRDGVEHPVEIAIRPARIGAEQLNILAIRDIAERKRMEKSLTELGHEAGHDALTGLPNRRLLENLLRHTLASAQRNGKLVAVCYCDLDGFKAVNDSQGHRIGDVLLAEAARRMEKCVRREDTVARVGGDEFVIVVAGMEQREDLTRVLDKLLEQIALPYCIEGKESRVTVSVGVSLFPEDGAEPEVLIRRADDALYAVKHLGKNGFLIFGEGRGPD